jgi:hypothetical protein
VNSVPIRPRSARTCPGIALLGREVVGCLGRVVRDRLGRRLWGGFARAVPVEGDSEVSADAGLGEHGSRLGIKAKAELDCYRGIRGSDGGRRMYSAGDFLPTLYTERFRTQPYNERVDHPGSWNKIALVAREDDDETILNHALIQSRRRNRT